MSAAVVVDFFDPSTPARESIARIGCGLEAVGVVGSEVGVGKSAAASESIAVAEVEAGD